MDIPVVIPEVAQPQLAVVVQPVETRNVLPGLVLGVGELECREVRVRVVRSVPLERPFRFDEQHLAGFDTSQPDVTLLGLLERRLRGNALIAVRLEVHQPRLRLSEPRVHTRSEPNRYVLIEVPNDVVTLQLHLRPNLVNGLWCVAEEAGHQRAVSCREGYEYVSIRKDSIQHHGTDGKADLLVLGELTLDTGDDVGRDGRRERGGQLALDDVLERPLDGGRVERTIDDALDDLFVLGGDAQQSLGETLVEFNDLSHDRLLSAVDFSDAICSGDLNW